MFKKYNTFTKMKFYQNLARRLYCTSKVKDVDVNNLRNIGILAHIDAGKTTTTERMLYYSGVIRQMGEVHHGNTVTDYMPQERERGITITAAVVTLNWKKHRFNLIDTPGHIDFTMEVEETLSVLDGAVVVLDGSAGVEAQTLTVWRQADRYKIPRIVFVNKMDRNDSDLTMCCHSVENKLEKPTLNLQFPFIEDNKFLGLVDVLTLEKWKWNLASKEVEKVELTEKNDNHLWVKAKTMRSALIDKLSGLNDNLANIVIAADSLDNIKTTDVVAALKSVTVDIKAIPVLCGSAYKNIGIEPLMNSIILYLPNPSERNHFFKCFGNNLSARAFKVIHNRQKGPLVFLRIYSGALQKGQKIYNIRQNVNEQTGKLYVPYADDFREVEILCQGNIAVISGSKQTVTGDIITNSLKVAQNAKDETLMLTVTEKLALNTENENLESIFETGTKIPEPVFFCSIEPPSLTYQAALEQALIELQREDPSLRVTHDSETGQTVLSGMGELHLEIIRDRILREYKIECDLGPLQIAYREAPKTKVSMNNTVENKIGNSKHSVGIALTLIPGCVDNEKDLLRLDKSPEAASNLANIFPKHLLAVKQGIDVALSHGPKISSKVVNTKIMLHKLEIGRGTSDTMISAATTQCVQKLLTDSGVDILEPIMTLEIVVPEERLSVVLADLSRRRSTIEDIAMRGKSKVVHCHTPLADLLGYSTTLRTLTSGTASYTMEFLEYQKMSTVDEISAIKTVRGF